MKIALIPAHRKSLALPLITGVIPFLFCFSIIAHGADQLINKNWRSIAINGYDPVAYFTMSKPVKGKAKFEHRWQDARWRFSNAKHRDMFAANPDQYAPMFGGYCAEGMAIGQKAKIDPNAWIIVEGKLYLNYDMEGLEAMASHPEETIAKAENFWQKLGKLLGTADK